MQLRNRKIEKKDNESQEEKQLIDESKNMDKKYSDNSRCFRSRGNYVKGEFFKVSRTTLELFLNCPTCSYFKHINGLKNIPSPGWSLNSCVDTLSKKEMDKHRENNTTPEILLNEKLKLYNHPDLSLWQNNFKGISYYDENTKFHLYGGIDNVAINEQGELVVFDVKATSKDENILTKENIFNNGDTYKRQLEIYTWLFMKNNFKVSNKGYILYYNGNKKVDDFNKRMTFRETLVPIELDLSWIDETIKDFYELLNSDTTPKLNENCDTCLYIKLRNCLL
jgi:hypothetical protein